MSGGARRKAPLLRACALIAFAASQLVGVVPFANRAPAAPPGSTPRMGETGRQGNELGNHRGSAGDRVQGSSPDAARTSVPSLDGPAVARGSELVVSQGAFDIAVKADAPVTSAAALTRQVQTVSIGARDGMMAQRLLESGGVPVAEVATFKG